MCLRACSLIYAVCHAHAPYCLWPDQLNHIFRRYLIKGTIFGKLFAEHKICVLIFFMTSEIFVILRRIPRDVVVNMEASICKVPVILVGF